MTATSEGEPLVATYVIRTDKQTISFDVPTDSPGHAEVQRFVDRWRQWMSNPSDLPVGADLNTGQGTVPVDYRDIVEITVRP